MHRILKKILWLLGLAGASAALYALLRGEGERVLRAVPRAPDRDRSAGTTGAAAASSGASRPSTSSASSSSSSSAASAPGGRCVATTQSGSRCTRPADEGSRYCWQHAAS